MKISLSPRDHDRIAETIRDAESRTSGEIYCVLARRSDDYFYPAACIAGAAMVLAGLVVSLVLETYWVQVRVPVFLSLQALALAAAAAVLLWVPALRLRLVPRRLQYKRAHDNALKQFFARNVHITSARTGVLVFVSISERYAEIVADSGINSRVAQEAWNGIVADLIEKAREDRLAEGFVAAVEAVGSLLAAHFPRRADDRNELDDHLVEI